MKWAHQLLFDSNEKMKARLEKRFCPWCGRDVEATFCDHCGKDVDDKNGDNDE